MPGLDMRTRVLALAVALLAVAAFAVFVWPTRYRPIALRITDVQGRVVAARQDRFTGEVEWLFSATPAFRRSGSAP
jgi:hypothetical protein